MNWKEKYFRLLRASEKMANTLEADRSGQVMRFVFYGRCSEFIERVRNELDEKEPPESKVIHYKQKS